MDPNSRATTEKKLFQKKRRSPFYCLGGLVILSLFLFGIILGGLLIAGFFQVDQSPKIIEIQKPSKEKPEQYTLSTAQNEILTDHGTPHTFAILFYTLENEQGTKVEVRDETWTYFNLGKVFEFINGELVGESLYPAQVTTTTRITCMPDQFVAYMDLDDIIAVTGLSQYLEIPLENELVPNSRLYYADRLTFSLQDGRLRYVETLPVEKEVN